MRKLIILLVGTVSLAAAGAAPAILGGAPDGGAHPYVGALRGGGELCSGSAVSPTVVVTAAHCFAPGSTVLVSFDESLAGATYVTGTVHDDPLFCFGCGNGAGGTDTHDVAVVVLDSPLSLGRYAVLPAVGAAANAGSVDTVGYGVQAFDKKTPTVFGARRVATSDIKGGGSTGAEFLKLAANPGACLGDSGGPSLAHGTDVILAITSYGHENCNGVSYAERLDTAAARGFVDAYL